MIIQQFLEKNLLITVVYTYIYIYLFLIGYFTFCANWLVILTTKCNICCSIVSNLCLVFSLSSDNFFLLFFTSLWYVCYLLTARQQSERTFVDVKSSLWFVCFQKSCARTTDSGLSSGPILLKSLFRQEGRHSDTTFFFWNVLNKYLSACTMENKSLLWCSFFLFSKWCLCLWKQLPPIKRRMCFLAMLLSVKFSAVVGRLLWSFHVLWMYTTTVGWPASLYPPFSQLR